MIVGVMSVCVCACVACRVWYVFVRAEDVGMCVTVGGELDLISWWGVRGQRCRNVLG